MSKKPDTFMNPRDTGKPLRSPSMEAAKFLASAARRFLAERATPSEVEDAITCWREARAAIEDTDTSRWALKEVWSDPHILGGEPVFKGTRLSVRYISEMVERGVPLAEILVDYPYLSADDVQHANVWIQANTKR